MQFIAGQWFKDKILAWSSGQGHFSTVKNLDHGCSLPIGVTP